MSENDIHKYNSFIFKLKTYSSVIYNGNECLIQSKFQDIQEMISNAQKSLIEGNLSESSKLFRQVATNINELYFKIEKKGSYNKKNSLNDLSGKEWLRHTKSWIIMDGKPSDIPREIKNHPASFPPELIEYFIEYFTKKDGWVIDPFMGIGSTAIACLNLNRNCWGTEINPKYFNYAFKRIEGRRIALNSSKDLTCKIINEDCRKLVNLHEKHKFPLIDFCITSPPYWNILETSRGGVKSTHKKRIENGLDEKYSNDPNDLGNFSNYKYYLNELEEIFNLIFKLLKFNGYLMIIVQNVRPKGGVMIPLAWDLAKILSKSYKLRQEFIWCQNQKQLGIWGYPKTYVSNVHHHYCLMFQK
ncbi:MAG: DNA methyltransferase [Candidatus Thorarchaeota archaeon]